MPLDIISAVQTAFDDDALSRRADLYAAEAMMRLASYHFDDAVLHASDLGKCKAAVWSRIHGQDSIPIPWTTKLKYFRFGALYGALLGAYFKVGLESLRPECHVVLEPELHYRGVVGHTDALVETANVEIAKTYTDAVEFKVNMNTSPPQAPHSRGALHQVFQSGFSACAAPAPEFHVATFGPAVENRRVNGKRSNPQIYDVTQYTLSDWRDRIDEDITRLQAALGENQPVPDPPARWWCESCNFGACTKNENPGNPTPKALEPA